MRLLAVAALFAAVSQAQDTAPIKVDVDVVNVLCTVRDNRGAYVKNLEQNDFEVFENGHRQSIRYFARETEVPLTVAMLLDVSGSVRRFIETEKETASQFLTDVLRPQDKALLIGFSSAVALWQNYTSSPEQLRASLDRLRPVQRLGNMMHWTPRGGGTLLYDAVYMTADNRLKQQSGRKAMVLITDGMDNGSRADVKLAIRAAQAMDTVIYSIYYGDKASRVHGAGVLRKMSGPTGGRMFRVSKETPLPTIFNTIREEMRSQYAIGFSPSNPAKDGTFRKLEIKLRPKGLAVQARKGYYAFREGER